MYLFNRCQTSAAHLPCLYIDKNICNNVWLSAESPFIYTYNSTDFYSFAIQLWQKSNSRLKIWMHKTWSLIIEWRHKKWRHFAWRHHIIKLIRLINYKIIFPSLVKKSIFYIETCPRYLTICITYWLTLVTGILFCKSTVVCFGLYRHF